MTPVLKELISLLDLERVRDNCFQGASQDIGTKRVYGGQVLGQALTAAQITVTEERAIHSLHAYFLREGDHNAPIDYQVEITRDGGSFSARRVVAMQQKRTIFIMGASFQIQEESLDFQPAMPDVPSPQSLAGAHIHGSMKLFKLPENLDRLIKLSAPFDIRSIEEVHNKRNPDTTSGTQFWIKTKDKLNNDAALHRAILAYISDYGLLPSTLNPHRLYPSDPALQMASIDHAMWFHRSFRMDDWLLYSCETISTSNSRGLARGSFFTKEGNLVATTIQEGLVRIRK